jgi:hypothetical protein
VWLRRRFDGNCRRWLQLTVTVTRVDMLHQTPNYNYCTTNCRTCTQFPLPVSYRRRRVTVNSRAYKPRYHSYFLVSSFSRTGWELHLTVSVDLVPLIDDFPRYSRLPIQTECVARTTSGEPSRARTSGRTGGGNLAPDCSWEPRYLPLWRQSRGGRAHCQSRKRRERVSAIP